jgi:hypothetical protein
MAETCDYPRCTKRSVALVLASRNRVCKTHANLESRWGATVVYDEET